LYRLCLDVIVDIKVVRVVLWLVIVEQSLRYRFPPPNRPWVRQSTHPISDRMKTFHNRIKMSTISWLSKPMADRLTAAFKLVYNPLKTRV
jgi:hypothetical protein